MKTAFVFPGQGSQSVGMLGDLAARYSEVQRCFSDASEALGYDLWALVQAGPEEELARTSVTQPLMLTAGVAVWSVWRSVSERVPEMMAGHSLGEYTALVCSGALDLPVAVRLVQQRGELMQHAVPEGAGAMVAIVGLDGEQVQRLCDEVQDQDVVAAANFNAPTQTVVAGSATAVDRLIAAARSAGAKRVVPLPVSAPFHCPLMEPVAEQLRPSVEAAGIRAPRIPVINNVHIRTEEAPEAIGEALLQQVYSPVRWVDLIREMKARGIEYIVECGPGKVLSGLTRRIDRDLTGAAMYDPGTIEKVLEQLSAPV